MAGFDFLRGLPTEYLQTLAQGLQGAGQAGVQVVSDQQKKEAEQKKLDADIFSTYAKDRSLKAGVAVPAYAQRYVDIGNMFGPKEDSGAGGFGKVGAMPIGQEAADYKNETVFGGRKVVNAETPLSAARLLESQAVQTNLADVRMKTGVMGEAKKNLNVQLRTLGTSLKGVDLMEENAKALPEYKSGIFNQTVARIDAFQNKYAKDPAFTQFSASVGQTLSKMARTFGEVGVLTDQDLIRAAEGTGSDPTIPLSQKIKVMNQIKDVARTNVEIAMEQAGETPTTISLKHPTFYKLIGGDGWANAYKKGERFSSERINVSGSTSGVKWNIRSK